MSYSDDDVKKLYQSIATIIKYDQRVVSLEDLRKNPKWKEINFQEKCEEGNLSIGDLLLKFADENDNSRVKDFLLENGCKPLPQEQTATVINKEEEEQNTPNAEENKAGSNEVDSNNFINPGMTAEVLYEQLIQGRETNLAIFDSFADAVRESNITGDRGIFLDVVKLFTDLDAVIHLTDTTSRTILDIAAIAEKADVVKVLLGSGKFNEEEKFNALRSAIVQGNVQEVEAFLGYVNDKSRRAALEWAMNNTQKEITQVLLDFIILETPNVEENIAKSSSNGSISSNKHEPIATVPPISTNNGDNLLNHNNEDETPIVTGKTNTEETAMPSSDNKANGLTNFQFPMPNKNETKHKESKENFYTSLTKDAVGVVITGLLITAAVMIPFVAGAVVCGVVAALVAIATGLHVKNSTLPSYREMEENKVKHVSSGIQKV